MKVLSLNSGSSSLRWGLFEVSGETPLAAGKVEEAHDAEHAWQLARPSLDALRPDQRPDAIGHRVVHGGERFTESTIIDDEVVRAIEEQIPLAPAHNPGCLVGIREAARAYPDIPHVAVFDTAFHQTMSPEAYLYALPYKLFEEDRVRRYGFHGTSHRYAAERGAVLLSSSATDIKLITCHLGNGCSIAAVKHGRSIDTSMGMTPLEGLMMGTRSGDVDPAIVLNLAARPELGVDGAASMLNNASGLLGVSGISSDLREIESAAASGHPRALLAIELFAHRVRRGIGAALGVLGGADAILFTGGIGEYSAAMRKRVCRDWAGLGIVLDDRANEGCSSREARISTNDSRVAVLVVPAREEWLIARETEATLSR